MNVVEFAKEIIGLENQKERLEMERKDHLAYIDKLEAENRKLKYEYEDSLLERDKPLHCKWRVKRFDNGERWTLFYCPKCEGGINNWMKYCPNCGQKIAEGLAKEMEITNGSN